MQDYTYTTRAGQTVVLTVEDMQAIATYYNQQNTADFIRENYDLSEDDIQQVAFDTRERMDDYEMPEGDAILEAIEHLDLFH